MVDAHVHLHAIFDTSAFLTGAVVNVRRAGPDAMGVLLLAESRGEGATARLGDLQGREGEWDAEPTHEPGSLVIRRAGNPVLVAVAGRQVVTAEGVEVLALMHPGEVREGDSLAGTLANIRRAGALPVLPWGFGKWTGQRGALVRDALHAQEGVIFLGDNGGRPEALPEPSLLAEARRLGVPVLPGSDPLPLRDHERRAASFGFQADVALDLDSMVAGVRAWLLATGTRPTVIGQRESPARFAWNQVRMQWRKRVTARV